MSERRSTENNGLKHGAEPSRRRSRSRSPHQKVKEEKDEENTKDKRPIDNIGLGAKSRLKSLGIQMKLSSAKPKDEKPKMSIAAVFNADEDSEPEEMPPEAKMRMRNIGRDTPTSSGPNSFGKTKQGFSDAKKVFEKNMKTNVNTTK